MNIKSLSSFDASKERSDFIFKYLTTIGINPSDARSLLEGPFEEDLDDWRKLMNIQKSIETFHELMERGVRRGFGQTDSDPDGYTSMVIFWSYMMERYPDLKMTIRLHEGKEHGVLMDTIPDDAYFVVIPDAGSMQLEEQQRLDAMGKYVFIFDHHTVTEMNKLDRVILVNNQCGNFPNKHLCGAAVVLMFIRGYDETYFPNNPIWRNYMDLAALGLISDMMRTDVKGNNYIIHFGLQNIRNKMFQTLLTKQNYYIEDISNPNKIDVAFYITPLINGLIRSGEQEEKEIFFRAMLDNNNTEIIETEFRGNNRSETIYEYSARIAGNAKARQDNAKKKGAAYLQDKIERENLTQNKLLAVCIPSKELTKVNQNITGLAAMELVKIYNRPVLILRENDETGLFCGSGRSKYWSEMPSLLDEIRKSGLAEYAEGHGNAFGVWFTKENLEKFVDYINEKLKNVDLDDEEVEVYYYFKNSKEVNLKMLEAFANTKNIYGNGIPQPKFAFDIVVDIDSINFVGKNSDTMKIKTSTIEFIQFDAGEVKEQMEKSNSHYFKLTVVGRPQINEFNGYRTLQIAIDKIEVEPTTGERSERRRLVDLF